MNREDATEILNGYELSRNWFAFANDNRSKLRPIHTALYFSIVEQCNRLGWPQEFGLPSAMTMHLIAISSYKNYYGALNDLIEFGFITMVSRSKNQHTANVVSLSKKYIGKKPGHVKDTEASTSYPGKKGIGEYLSEGSVLKPLNDKTLKPKKTKKVSFPFDSENFIKWWDTWKQYKKDQFNFKYKSVISEQSALKILVTCSGGIESSAISIIEKSIAQGWKGFYEPEQNGKSKEEVKWIGF